MSRQLFPARQMQTKERRNPDITIASRISPGCRSERIARATARSDRLITGVPLKHGNIRCSRNEDDG